MKFLTQMKTCDVVTVSSGIIQAIKGPVAYIGYNERLANVTFAVDAKMFTAAIKKLSDQFHITVEDDKVIMFDDRQEVSFIMQPAEQLLKLPESGWQPVNDFIKHWNTAYAFMSTDFPGIAIKDGFLEILSDKSIARITDATKLPESIYAGVKLPAALQNVVVYDDKLWLRATPFDYIVVNKLNVTFPDVGAYFEDWPTEWISIPKALRDKFIETKLVRFDNHDVRFIEEEKATAIVENIFGMGTYEGKLFKNMLNIATSYSFTEQYLAFKNLGIKGIIANVEH